MATVNVTTANTFEEWRTKTNEVGTAIGNLTDLTVGNSGHATLIGAVNSHQGIVASSLASTGGTMTGDMNFNDNVDANFGTGTDLKITHNGTNTSLTNITGQFRLGGNDIRIQTQNHSEDYILCVDGGAVTLHHNDNAKIATTTTGVDVTGVITADGLDMEDNHKILLGAGDDLQLYHNGSSSFIDDTGTGALNIHTNAIRINTAGGTEAMIAADDGDGVDLFFNDAKKFETTVVGGTIHGALTADNVNIADSIIHTGDTDNKISFTTDIQKYYTGGSERLKIYNTGIDVTGAVAVSGSLNATTLKYGGTDIYSASGFTTAVHATVGAMVSSNTESGIGVTYQASDNTLDFDVNDPTITLTGAVTGSGTITNLGSVSIATTSGAGNIITADIANLAVTTAKLANDAVTNAKIADNSIDSEHYVDGSIDLAHMSANSIDSNQYVDGSIDTAHIAADQIVASLIADNAINSEHYTDGSIDSVHIAASPGFTGTPTAPTAATATNTTQIATTAMVQAAIDTDVTTHAALRSSQTVFGHAKIWVSGGDLYIATS
jgi:hypothetical protein